MKNTPLFSVLGVVGGAVVGAAIALHGVENSFGFTVSDPNVFEVEQSELSLLGWSMGGSVLGFLLARSAFAPTDKELLKELAARNEHYFTVEALAELTGGE